VASTRTVEQIRKRIGVDTLAYLSPEGMLEAMPLPSEKFCTACFTGKYPVPVRDRISKLQFENQPE